MKKLVSFPHGAFDCVDECLCVFDRRHWQNSMSQISDVTEPTSPDQHFLDPLPNTLGSSEQGARIEIPLNRELIADASSGFREINSPVDTQH